MLEMKNNYCHHYSNQHYMNKNNNNGKLIHFSHLIILILLLIFNVTSANHHVMHNVVKRMDLESCLGRFYYFSYSAYYILLGTNGNTDCSTDSSNNLRNKTLFYLCGF
jgi:hypothetical protein